MARRYSVYPETSFWNRLGEALEDDRRKISYRFLRIVTRRHLVFTSKLVLEEIGHTTEPDSRRQIIRRLWGTRPRMITSSARMGRMAVDLLEMGNWGEDRFADMLHVAYAINSGLDALVSWDEEDLARPRTREVVQAYGRRKGLLVPLIGRPEEVSEWLGLRMK